MHLVTLHLVTFQQEFIEWVDSLSFPATVLTFISSKQDK